MKIVFMGTPDYAAAALEALIKAGHEITAVVTQPDKPKGRSKELQAPPVKELALKHNIPVFQPERIKRPEAVAELRKYEADIFVVAAFGQILSKEILEMPRFGSVNIHASLLPKYRGAAPIQWAILNGDKTTGITIMQMGIGIDDGDILCQSSVTIEDTETGDSLFDKLTLEGARLIVEALPKIERGELIPVKQDEAAATHVGKIEKSLGKLDFSKSAVVLDRQIRGLTSWPSSFTTWNGKQLKVWGAKPLTAQEAECEGFVAGEPGMVGKTTKDAVYVQTGDGILKITAVQLEGKKRMDMNAFQLGYSIKVGEQLGEK